MADFFTKARIQNIIVAATLIILGILFCVLGGDIIRILGYICGGLLMVLGIILILMYFIDFKKQNSAKNFIYGALAFVGGLILVISNAGIEWLMVIAVGFFLCSLGVIYMAKAFEKIRVGNKHVWKELIYGIISFVLGIVLLILQMTAFDAVMIFMGVALIVAGICLCVLAIFMDKVTVSIKKQLEKEDKKEEVAKETKENKSTKKTTKKSSN